MFLISNPILLRKSQRLAVSFTRRENIFGKAVELSGMDYSSFMELIGNFGIYHHYDKMS